MPLTALDVDDALSAAKTTSTNMLAEAARVYYKPYDDAKRKAVWVQIMKQIGATYPQMAGMNAAEIEAELRKLNGAKVDELKKMLNELEVQHG
jgi:hypothetical protein